MNRPQTPFAVLALITLVILFFEFQVVRGQFGALTSARTGNAAKQEELDRRTARLKAMKADMPFYQEAFEQLLDAYTDAPLDPSQFGALYDLNPTIKVHENAKQRPGLQPVSNRPGAGRLGNQAVQTTWSYDLTSTSVEFHRFLPALAETENNLPLLRFTKLTITSPKEPFYMEAIPLNITATMTTLRSGAAAANK
ncbi:MAG: hypothetical protein JO015_01030 [Verrucomicrobia bacterium]|nr:hypothetical protein [Verrucomicrobiota bacterium]